MNTANCSAGFATDEVFRLNLSPPCSVSLSDYELGVTILVLFRFVTLTSLWNDWLKKKRKYSPRNKQAALANRQQQQEDDNTGREYYKHKQRWERRFPIVPMISTILFAIWIIVFALVSANHSNAHNGLSFFFLTLTFNMFAAYSLMFQRKIIRLGERVVPSTRRKRSRHQAAGATGGSSLSQQQQQLSNRSLFGLGNSSSADSDVQPNSTNQQRLEDLRTQLRSFDCNLRIILVMQTICIGVQTLCGFVLGFIFPDSFVVMQIAFVTQGLYMSQNGLALAYQLHRVVACIWQSRIQNKIKVKVLAKIHSQQLHFVVISTLGLVINLLLASGTIAFAWYIFLYWIAIETSVSAFSVIELGGRVCFSSRRHPHHSQSSNSNKGPFFFLNWFTRQHNHHQQSSNTDPANINNNKRPDTFEEEPASGGSVVGGKDKSSMLGRATSTAEEYATNFSPPVPSGSVLVVKENPVFELEERHHHKKSDNDKQAARRTSDQLMLLIKVHDNYDNGEEDDRENSTSSLHAQHPLRARELSF